MEKKRIPFDFGMAKKIQAREIKGRIVCINGKIPRILCFDKKVTDYPIVALVEDNHGKEFVRCYTKYGIVWSETYQNGESGLHLCIELPEDA